MLNPAIWLCLLCVLISLPGCAGKHAGVPPAAGAAAAPDAAAAWLARQRATVAPRDYELLARAQATLLRNIGDPDDVAEANTCGGRPPAEKGRPLPWHPLRGIYPSPFRYRGVWNWDGAFHALAVARWDPQLAREQFEIILRHQQESGLLPDVIMESGEIVTGFGKPPVMPWAVMRVDRIAPDTEFLAAAYGKFQAFERHLMANRGGAAEGLFHYGGDQPALESGWDNSVRWDNGCDNLWTIDLNCYMVMMYEALAYMAGRLDRPEEQTAWLRRAREVGAQINARLWDERTGAYLDRDRFTGAFSDVLTPASFMPLYVKIATPERAARMARLAADPDKLYPGMPSVSYDHPEYRRDDFWRGPTWVNVAYFALKGLKHYGHDRLAEDCRATILDWCRQNPDELWEYYDSRDGRGIGARRYGWTGTFVIEFILNWDEPRPQGA